MGGWDRVARALAAWAAVTVVVALAAGPVAASPARPAKPKGSCKLLTVREVRNILGGAVGAGKPTVRHASGQTNQSCQWAMKKKGTGGIKGQPLELEIAVESGPGLVDDYNLVKAKDPLTTDKIAGLGDDAFSKDEKVHVLVGERVVSSALHNYRFPDPLPTDDIQKREETAVELVLSRLG